MHIFFEWFENSHGKPSSDWTDKFFLINVSITLYMFWLNFRCVKFLNCLSNNVGSLWSDKKILLLWTCRKISQYKLIL